MYKTIKGVYGKNKLVDLETLEFYNVQLPTQIVGIFMLLIEMVKLSWSSMLFGEIVGIGGG